MPTGRPTLVCGSAGCGKSLLATEFLIRGVMQYGEPGVLMTFEESAEDIAKNVASLGFDVAKLTKQKKLVVDHVQFPSTRHEKTLSRAPPRGAGQLSLPM